MTVWAWIIGVSFGMTCACTALAWAIARRGDIYDKEMGLGSEEKE